MSLERSFDITLWPMATIRFTSHLVRHRPAPAIEAAGATVAEVLAAGLAGDDLLQSYVLDEQGRVRKHVNIYLDGVMIGDRLRLSDPVRPGAEIYVLQALSGG
ncbi:MAG: MoaD/ThiS family protein [bacterium]